VGRFCVPGSGRCAKRRAATHRVAALFVLLLDVRAVEVFAGVLAVPEAPVAAPRLRAELGRGEDLLEEAPGFEEEVEAFVGRGHVLRVVDG